jgi:hypothetical protein
VGVTAGTWHFDETPSDLPGDESSAIAAIAHRLEAVTGLRVERRHEGRTLRIPTRGEALFDWAFSDRTISVLGFMPEHPHLWENLDAVMAAAGGATLRPTSGGPTRHTPDCERAGTTCRRAIASCLGCPLCSLRGLSIVCSHRRLVDSIAPKVYRSALSHRIRFRRAKSRIAPSAWRCRPGFHWRSI